MIHLPEYYIQYAKVRWNSINNALLSFGNSTNSCGYHNMDGSKRSCHQCVVTARLIPATSMSIIERKLLYVAIFNLVSPDPLTTTCSSLHRKVRRLKEPLAPIRGERSTKNNNPNRRLRVKYLSHYRRLKVNTSCFVSRDLETIILRKLQNYRINRARLAGDQN